MQMVIMPYDFFLLKEGRKKTIRIKMPAITLIKLQLNQMTAHSVRADPPPSRAT
jgi:hypothetical protein